MEGIHFKRLKNGTLLLLGGEGVFQICGFLRNLVVARAIDPSDFGIAAAIAMAASFVEILAGLDVGRFLTRKQDKNMEEWLGIAHGVAVMRGVITAILLGLFGGLIADFMKMGAYSWAFQAIGIVPLLRALSNYSLWVEQRNFNYKSFVACQTIPQVITLLAAFPVLYFVEDYRTLLLLSVLNAGLYCLTSHLVAGEKYRILVNADKFRELSSYIIPLWMDAALMFAVLQGERVIVVREFGAALAGVYSVAFMLSWTPAAVLSRLGQSIGVPHFSRILDKPSMLARDYWLISSITFSLAIGFVAVFALSSSSMITFVFGDAYEAPALLIILLGAHYGFRIGRIPPTIVILAHGRTRSIAQANLIRVVGVGVSWVTALSTGSLTSVFFAAVLSEFLAMLILMVAVRPIAGFFSGILTFTCSVILGLCFLGQYWSQSPVFQANADWVNLGVAILVGLVLILVNFLILMRMQPEVWGLVKRKLLENSTD
ncbi:oligosaccharide flippase family protein [Sneathiella chinensis]|uniref:Uncharacterized protein n=1 Tax=Sneathiella chinensis TaxID=349750 RepID=A0ABQ5U7N6_9PROT|nr:oligosaccharide flippase family protein [Sneathiella chinensis]GLQ07928.1 hypothetical protein GCM10007924_31500 [Sneathiella chinensis]